jgi:Transmembrane secretion effector
MVISTWTVDREELTDFLAVMGEVRLVRLRTGAYRWRLYRNVEDPLRISEAFLTVTWQEHLAQHRRIDDASAGVIRRARAFDHHGGPVTRHLVAIDVADEDEWEALVAMHDEYHSTDGSIPLGDEV